MPSAWSLACVNHIEDLLEVVLQARISHTHLQTVEAMLFTESMGANLALKRPGRKSTSHICHFGRLVRNKKTKQVSLNLVRN